MKARIFYTGCLLCASLLFTSCAKDSIHFARPTVTITGNYELHKGEELGTLKPAGSVEYNGQQVEGTLAWKDASITYHETGEQQAEWVFTPAEESLYAVVEGKTVVTVMPDIYACGAYQDGQGTKVWKNGNILYERPDNGYTIVSISEGNIFTSGFTIQLYLRPMICKNGTLLYSLSDGSNAVYFGNWVVSDGHIYVCGYEKNENQKQVVKIWKDDIPLYTLTDGSKDAFPGHSIAIVDGSLYTLSEEYSNSKCVTKIWKNDKVLYKTDESLDTKAIDMAISNGHIYLCVKEKSGNDSTIKVLKDGKPLYKLTDGSHFAQAYSMVVSGGDVYTCGFEDFKTNVRTGKIWKNDTLLYSTDGVSYTDIAVD